MVRHNTLARLLEHPLHDTTRYVRPLLRPAQRLVLRSINVRVQIRGWLLILETSKVTVDSGESGGDEAVELCLRLQRPMRMSSFGPEIIELLARVSGIDS